MREFHRHTLAVLNPVAISIYFYFYFYFCLVEVNLIEQVAHTY